MSCSPCEKLVSHTAAFLKNFFPFITPSLLLAIWRVWAFSSLLLIEAALGKEGTVPKMLGARPPRDLKDLGL